MQRSDPQALAEEAVLAAVCYTDIFAFAPHTHELATYIPIVALSDTEIQAAVDRLTAAGRLGRTDDLVYLPGRTELAALRRERAAVVARRMAQVRRRLPSLLAVPWVKGAFLTGSLAAGNPTPDADVDLFLVLDRRRMWLGYLLIRLWARRRAAVEFCPNYCVADDSLHLLYPNLFTAVEWSMAKPLKCTPTTAEMARVNAWSRALVPNAPDLETKCVDLPRADRPGLGWRLLSALLRSPLGAWLDALEFRRLQWRTHGNYLPGGHIYKPHPPKRQFHIFEALQERLTAHAVALPALRTHVAGALGDLRKQMEAWQQTGQAADPARKGAAHLAPGACKN